MKTKIKPGQIVTFAWARDLKEWDSPRLIVLNKGPVSGRCRCYCYYSPEVQREAWTGTIFNNVICDKLLVISEVQGEIKGNKTK